MNKKILFISYYSNLPGACQAEWADDKIISLLIGGNQVELITSICSDSKNLKIRIWRVPSLSLHDFKDEFHRLKSQLKLKLPFQVALLLPFIFIFGKLSDLVLKLATNGIGEGRWSWTFTATIATFIACIFNRPDIILSTGGPASAHLAGIIVSKLLNIPLNVELQDPLSGENIGRNGKSAKYLELVENFIIKNSNKTFYVTKQASVTAKIKYRSDRIDFAYPGARMFATELENLSCPSEDRITFIHLGSLYSTRSFDFLINSLDYLISRGEISSEDFKLINLGHVENQIRLKIENKIYVQILPPVPRVEALKIASICNFNLLIQNTDNRSVATIPYKTYDYLNLKNATILLHNNLELEELIKIHGHIAIPLANQDLLTNELRRIFSDRPNTRTYMPSQIDPVIQAEKIISV